MKKKIFFIAPSLAGGLGRIIVYLLRYLDRSKFELSVVVLDSRNDYKELVPSDVKIIFLDKKGRFDFFRLILSLSRIIKIENPFTIFAFSTYINYLSVLAKMLSISKIPLFLSERNNLLISLKNERFTFIKKIIIRNLYPKANAIIAPSEGVKRDLIVNFGIKEKKCKLIYNGTDLDNIKILSMEPVDHPWFKENIPVIVACGRLSKQKNYPMLLKSIEIIKEKQSARLLILGDGEERSKLESLVRKFGIRDKIDFLGFQKTPFKFIAKATLFVLTSLWEGFPNVLVEAMACGVPVISTNCPSGADEIITNGINGMIIPVNNEKALSEAIMRLLKNNSLRKRLAEEGRKRAEDFRIEKMVAEYEQIIESL